MAKGKDTERLIETIIAPDDITSPPVIKGKTNPDELGEAFRIINKYLDMGWAFNDEQKDAGIRISLDALPTDERPWFKEIANMHRISLWETVWGQYRRCQENGLASAPILDPGWEEKRLAVGKVEETSGECSICHTVFEIKQHGQKFCSNACGAEEERIRRGLSRPSEQQLELAE